MPQALTPLVCVIQTPTTPLLKRKPLEVVHAEEQTDFLQRTLGFWDLAAIGIGGTIGSGVFVLCGIISSEYAGPAGLLSWLLAGAGCIISGLSYAELSCYIPSAGSAYAYAYVILGELPAVIVAWCLTLEYGISGAAVSRSWGDKFDMWLDQIGWGGEPLIEGISFSGALLQAAAVAIVMCGMDVSKMTVNIFCVLKLLLVAFMILTAFGLFDSSNLEPFAPYGAPGVLRGAISAYFGYLGFDEVCMLQMESKDPRHVPRALILSIAVVALVYSLAALGLSGMLPYTEIDSGSGFADGFRDRGLEWAYHATVFGEVLTLPLVVLVSFMAQPRLMFALSEDGLLPSRFKEVDAKGTLYNASLWSGALCVAITAVVPFSYLDDTISAGVLLSFNFSQSCLIVMRISGLEPHGSSFRSSVDSSSDLDQENETGTSSGREPDAFSPIFHRSWRERMGRCSSEPQGLQQSPIALVAWLNALSWGAASFWVFSTTYVDAMAILTYVSMVAFGAVVLALHQATGGSRRAIGLASGMGDDAFAVPAVPFLPSLGILMNWYMIAQMSWVGAVSLLLFVAFGVMHYLLFGRHSSVGNGTGWGHILREVSPRDPFCKATRRFLFISNPSGARISSRAFTDRPAESFESGEA
ncbi:unnamed protein product [Chrysoparadoxa australica]